MARKIGNGLDLVNQRITNLGDPSAATDAANKQYVDAYVRGLDYKAEVVAASTTNVPLTAPGATLDGVTLSVGMQVLPVLGTVTRILLKDQTAPAENGVYDWTGAAAALTRSTDAATGPTLSGSSTTVQRGTINADRLYHCNTDDPITLGTTSITWAQIGAGGTPYAAGVGLSLTGQTFAVVPGAGIIADGTSTRIDPAIVVRKFAMTVGGTTLINVDHNLGTADTEITVFDIATGDEEWPDVNHVVGNVNRISLTYAVAPAASSKRVLVVG